MRFANRPFSSALSLYAIVTALQPQQKNSLSWQCQIMSGSADRVCFLDSTVLCHLLCGAADGVWYGDNTFGDAHHPEHAT